MTIPAPKKKKLAPQHARIRAGLRMVWMRSPERTEALRRAKVAPRGGGWWCAGCHFPTPEKAVDHIVPVGPTPGSRLAPPDLTWDQYLARLFVPPESLQVLCLECHNKKTKG